MATRTTGSPRRRTAWAMKPVSSRSSIPASRRTWPVSISAQVEALTRKESFSPRWLRQLDEPILSRIKASTVGASGVRK